VTLSQAKWNTICSQPERYYYRHNGEKVSTTLIAPDYVRHHKTISTQFLYYKKFEDGPLPCNYFVVVIDTATQRICTVYPTEKPRPGTKEYKPEGAAR
jgi:hypothetical protein